MSKSKLSSAARLVVGSLCGVLVVGAGLLVDVVAKEIHEEPRVIYPVIQSGSANQSDWKAFISEGHYLDSMRGWKFKATVSAPQPGHQG